jgi:hypothetical protein
MIYRCCAPLLTETGVWTCDRSATHFDSRALPRKRLYCEEHRASDDPPIGLLDLISPRWKASTR